MHWDVANLLPGRVTLVCGTAIVQDGGFPAFWIGSFQRDSGVESGTVG